jgi:hypothetical protein
MRQREPSLCQEGVAGGDGASRWKGAEDGITVARSPSEWQHRSMLAPFCPVASAGARSHLLLTAAPVAVAELRLRTFDA